MNDLPWLGHGMPASSLHQTKATAEPWLILFAQFLARACACLTALFPILKFSGKASNLSLTTECKPRLSLPCQTEV